MSTIAKRIEKIKNQIAQGNAYGEKVTLVAATKMQSAQAINAAIAGGVDAVAENKAQEFRDKYGDVNDCPRHFIGHLQTNKLKYVVGKVDLIHSCDRDDLLAEISNLSVKKDVVSNVLLQVNIGDEESKGGYAYEQAKTVFLRAVNMPNVCVKGFMAMLPDIDNETLLRALVRKMRALFDWAKTQSQDVEFLSMGMSGDYMLCIEEGSNMIRVGSTIFGARDYGQA